MPVFLGRLEAEVPPGAEARSGAESRARDAAAELGAEPRGGQGQLVRTGGGRGIVAAEGEAVVGQRDRAVAERGVGAQPEAPQVVGLDLAEGRPRRIVDRLDRELALFLREAIEGYDAGRLEGGQGKGGEGDRDHRRGASE